MPLPIAIKVLLGDLLESLARRLAGTVKEEIERVGDGPSHPLSYQDVERQRAQIRQATHAAPAVETTPRRPPVCEHGATPMNVKLPPRS